MKIDKKKHMHLLICSKEKQGNKPKLKRPIKGRKKGFEKGQNKGEVGTVSGIEEGVCQTLS